MPRWRSPAMMVAGAVQAERREGDRAAVGERQPERLGDLQDVGVPVDGVEDVDLFAVVRALDDGQEVVLALGQQRGGHPDVVHRVVDAVEAEADPRTRHQDQGAERGPGGDEDPLEREAAARGAGSGAGRSGPVLPWQSSLAPPPVPGPPAGTADLRARNLRSRHCPAVARWVRCGCRDQDVGLDVTGSPSAMLVSWERRPCGATRRPTRTAPAGGTFLPAPATSW